MVLFDGGFALIAFAVWVFCIIDVITTPNGQTRNLPKLVWLMLVVLLVDIGSIAWLIGGRNWSRRPMGLPGRTTPARAGNPDDDEEFLASLRVRAEEQRRRAAEAKRRDDPEDEPPSR
jgi:hypothetical protein